MITGIPSGARFRRFDAFGIYTRLTATGLQDGRPVHPHRHLSPAPRQVSATSPSIPAVLRPALRCVTRRTLTSVLDRLRSISFCRFLTLGQSCSCAALKIRCRSRRTSSSRVRQSMASQSEDRVLRSVHRHRVHPRVRQHGVQLALRFRRLCPHRFKGSPAHVSTLSGPGSSPVSGQLSGTAGGGAGHAVPVSCRLSAHRRSLLGHPVPARGLGLPYRPAYRRRLTAPRTPTGFSCSACASCDRGGRPLYPEASGVHPTDEDSPAAACRSSTARPCTPLSIPSPGALRSRGISGGSLTFARPAFPSPATPGWNEDALRLLP